VGAVLATAMLAALVLALTEPSTLARDVTLGLGFVPTAGTSRWTSPVAIACCVLAAGFVAHCLRARNPLVDLRAWARVLRRADLVGAGLLALALSGVILAFATADPEVRVFSPWGPWLLLGSAAASAAFWWRTRTAASPLLPPGVFRRRPAWGALAVSFFAGAALIAALVDIPLYARITAYPDSQLMAALVLARLLVALPVGALLGGVLLHRLPAGPVTVVAMGLTAAGFVWMSRWDLHSLEQASATVPLVLTGFGFGLALAPVSAALLAATEHGVHGVASALLVVARMVGMLIGISALTTIGLRRYYAVQVTLPSPSEVCDGGTRCSAYTDLLKEAGLAQLQTVFAGAALCAATAGLIAIVVFRSVQTRGVSTAEVLRQPG
jgi:hypothetical protein